MASSLLLLFTLVLLLGTFVVSAPTGSSTSTSPFCHSSFRTNQAFNIGPNFYLVQNSLSVYRFDEAQQGLSDRRFTIKELFGKNKFQWVDTVISLNGLCLNTGPLCDSDSWSEMERLHLVIGQRRLTNGDKSYGYALYDLDPASQQFTPIEQPSENLVQRLNDLGIKFNPIEHEGALMLGDFWPNLPGNLYYQSGVFVPSRAELLINVYDSSMPFVQHIVRRKLSGQRDQDSNPGSEWNQTSTIESPLGFKGMFRIGDRVFGMDGDNLVHELSWTGVDNTIQFDRLGHLKEFLNCYDNSTVIGENAKLMTTTTTTTTTTPATSTTSSTTTTTTTQAPSTTTPIPSSSSPSSTPTKSHDLEVEDNSVHVSEVELLPSMPSNSLDPHHIGRDPEESSAEIREELPHRPKPSTDDEDSDKIVNDIRHRTQMAPSMGKDGDLLDEHLQQNDAPGNSLAEASARGPFYPPDDGLLWTFSILVGVLILLSLIILIPIIIIRHKSRTDRLYLNKVAKLNTSNNSEEVQLMNASTAP